MYYHGSFLDRHGKTVTVHIVTGGDRSTSTEIGADGGDMYFPPSPVEITDSLNDSFDVLLRHAATITLQARGLTADLFTRTCREATVNIMRDGRCLFAGFIEPQTYSQPFNEVWDEITVNCVDALSALQYSHYRGLDMGGAAYATAKSEAAMLPMKSIVTTILTDLTAGLRLSGSGTTRIWYDGSKSKTGAAGDYAVLDDTSIAELLFLGDDEDSVWTQEDVLTEILRYFNLHIVQEGFDFYIFDWKSAAGAASIAWRDLRSTATQTTARRTLAISADAGSGKAQAADTDTQITIGEVYNRVSLTCQLDEIDTLVESPLDDSSLTSPYSGMQLYMREYYRSGTGKKGKVVYRDDIPPFARLIQCTSPTNLVPLTFDEPIEHAWIRDWFIRIMAHPAWTFPYPGGEYYEQYCHGRSQETLPNLLTGRLGACLLAWGSIKHETDLKDNSPKGRPEMNTALVIPVNGSEDTATPENSRPTAEQLRAAAPVAVYRGPSGCGVYSPADEETTNYIVISGTVTLNGTPKTSWWPGRGEPAVENSNGAWVPKNCEWHPDRSGEGQHYYARRFYGAPHPAQCPVLAATQTKGLLPFSETDPAELEYSHSKVGSSTDTVSKMAVLACRLVIGDKCLVEYPTRDSEHRPGYDSPEFVWQTFKERSECADDDEYHAQSFTIGIDPKIGDKIIGNTFPIQNTIPYWLGIDAEGTAIPIKKSDALSGAVRFEILGPVNTVWNKVTKRHRTWFRREKWSTADVLILPKLTNITVGDFEVKLYSDNGGDDPTEECDLVYVSDTDESYVNLHDDTTFRISSALTADERRLLGIREAVRLCTASDTATGSGVTALYDRHTGARVKPEQAYVDAYYSEYHKPRITLRQAVEDTGDAAERFNRYTHPALPGRTFYVQAVSRNPGEGTATLTLKESWA